MANLYIDSGKILKSIDNGFIIDASNVKCTYGDISMSIPDVLVALAQRIQAIESSQSIVTYTINWDDNNATTAHSGGSTSVTQGNTVNLPTTSPKREYTITWKLQNGTAGSTSGTTSVTYGFKGWYTAASGGSQVTNETIPTSTSTYYAQWNTQNPTSITVPSDPTRSGYTFKGWYTAASGGSQVTTGDRTITQNTNFYAQWDQNSSQSTTYYWYLGYDQDLFDNPESSKSKMLTLTSNNAPTQYTQASGNKYQIPGTTPNYLIMVVPTSWSVPVIGNPAGGQIALGKEKSDISITGISGVTFDVYSTVSEATISEVYIN